MSRCFTSGVAAHLKFLSCQRGWNSRLKNKRILIAVVLSSYRELFRKLNCEFLFSSLATCEVLVGQMLHLIVIKPKFSRVLNYLSQQLISF